MHKINREYEHLINNLERISLKNSIFDSEPGQKAFLSLGQGCHLEWLKTMLPDTRLIIEPEIDGYDIALSYNEGKLIQAINAKSNDISKKLKLISNIPPYIPIKREIQIRGTIYTRLKLTNNLIKKRFNNKEKIYHGQKQNFCAFQIINCNLNHFQSLQELKKLGFEIPQTQFTHYTTDIEIYLQLWRGGRLFENYPTNGIILKINSKKLQKYLGQNNVSINWAYAIK